MCYSRRQNTRVICSAATVEPNGRSALVTGISARKSVDMKNSVTGRSIVYLAPREEPCVINGNADAMQVQTLGLDLRLLSH